MAQLADTASKADASSAGSVERPPLRPGWTVVARKELADHLLSVRFGVLLILLALVAAGTVFAASDAIRGVAEQAAGVPGVFLRLFTVATDRVPSFISLVALLIPLLGIAFGFDAVNGERAQRTLPRLLSQPIHRDDVINGKFAAGLTVIMLVLASVTLLVAGLGLLRLGIRPAADEVARLLVWLLVSVIYVSFWLAFSTLCSVALRRAATSALVAIGAWLLLSLFAPLLAGIIADGIRPVSDQATVERVLSNARLENALARISPSTLYDEATRAFLNPETRTLGAVLPQQTDRAVPSTLSLEQSVLLVWPQTVGLIALTVVCFALAYITFMRQEIRA